MKSVTKPNVVSILLTFLILFSFPAAALCGNQSSVDRKKAKNKKPEQTAVSPPSKRTAAEKYRKLLSGKDSRKVSGLLTLHKKGDDVYLEIPVAMLERELLIGATVVDISDYGESSEGMKPVKPRRVAFKRVDSLLQIVLLDRVPVTHTDDAAIGAALRNYALPPVIESFPIAAWSPDSSAVVFKATKFFIGGSDQFSPKDPLSYNSGEGIVGRDYKFLDKLSFVRDIAASDNNVSVTTVMTYEVTAKLLGLLTTTPARPVTATVQISILLPAKIPASIRNADPRVGTAVTPYTEYPGDGQGVRRKYMANRWRLEPSDSSAYRSGYAVEPLSPIVFHLDPNFPESWKKHIISGVLSWNRAFRQAGFIDAVRVEESDSLTVNDIRHSTIRYITTPSRSIRSSVWTDPRTGEIFSANIYISHDIVKRIRDNRLFQTGAADPRARTLATDAEVLGESIEAEVARAVGLCLGLTPNLAGSYAIAVDSLRSASFTNTYGLSSSIMDELPYNFLASESDVAKGVMLCQTEPGVYDRSAIRWLYGPDTSESNAIENPLTKNYNTGLWYRYGAKESSRYSYDPRSIGQDLGDSAFASSSAGIARLAETARNLDTWLDSQDDDYSYRSGAYKIIQNQLNNYLKPIMSNIGGLYINDSWSGDAVQVVGTVSRWEQRRSLIWVLEVIDSLDWMDDAGIGVVSQLNANASDYIRLSVMKSLLRQIDRLPFSQFKSDNPYTRSDAYGDISKYLFADMVGKRLPDYRRDIDREFVNTLLQKAGYAPLKTVKISGSNSSTGLYSGESAICTAECDQSDLSAFVPIAGIMYNVSPDERHKFYALLIELRSSLKQCSTHSVDSASRRHYDNLLFGIESAMSH